MYRKSHYFILIVGLACTAVQADLRLVENFDAMTGHPDGQACTGVMGGAWDTQSEGTGNISLATVNGSNVGNVIGHSSGNNARAIGFNGITNPIDNQETGIAFCRFWLRDTSRAARTYMGLITDTSDNPIVNASSNDPMAVPAGFSWTDDGAGGMDLVTTDGVTVLKAGLARGIWYNVWIVANNEVDTFDLYLREAEGPTGEVTLPAPEDLVQSAIPFGIATTDPLTGMIWANPAGSGQADRFYIDEIWWDGDQGLEAPTAARKPSPGKNAEDVARDVALSWTPPESAVSHNVYMGTNADDVASATVDDPRGVLVSSAQDANSYVPETHLTLGETYYWRVDEVNDQHPESPWLGSVWRFTVEPVGVELPQASITVTASGSRDAQQIPENTMNGSGLDAEGGHGFESDSMWLSNEDPNGAWIEYAFDQAYKLHEMWIWNHNTLNESIFGFGMKDVVISYSADGTTWTPVPEVNQLARAPGQAGYQANTTVDLNGLVASRIRIDAGSNWGGLVNTFGLSEVRFSFIPTFVRELEPIDGTDLNSAEVTLSWRNGREAARHQVYLDVDHNLALVEGSDPAALAAVLEAAGSRDSHTVSELLLSKTYVWKIVEHNEAETPAAYEGPILSFTTPDFLVVDNMESYSNEEDARIFNTWKDGFEDPAANGALVGADPQINDYSPETAIVHTGSQSLPIHFDNNAAPTSEAVNTFAEPQNWSLSGITTLSLFVYQGDDNSGGRLYVKINNSKLSLQDNSVYPGGFNPGWVQYNVDLTTLDASNVRSLAVGVEGAGAKGVIYVDNIRLYAVAPELMILTAVGTVIEAESGVITAPFEVMTDRADASGAQYINTDESVGDSSANPSAPEDGWAVYTINIPASGDYVVALRGAELDSDSFWVNIPGMVVNDDDLHGSGFLESNGLFNGDNFVWDFVRDTASSDTDPVVFTLAAGQHELQIARREDGTALDAIAIFAVD